MTIRAYTLGETITLRLVVTINPTVLMAPAAAGATSITVADITGYAAADVVVINPNHPDEREEQIAVSGSPSGKTIVLSSGLAFAHGKGEPVGELASPTTVVLTILQPDGTTTTPSVSGSTGNRTAEFTPTQEGDHHYEWTTTGSGKGETEGTFRVLASQVA